MAMRNGLRQAINRAEDGQLQFSEENGLPDEFFAALRAIDNNLFEQKKAHRRQWLQPLPLISGTLDEREARVVWWGERSDALKELENSFNDLIREVQDRDREEEQRKLHILQKLGEFEKLYREHRPIFLGVPRYAQLGILLLVAGILLVFLAVWGGSVISGLFAAAWALPSIQILGLVSGAALVAGSLKYGFFARDNIIDQTKKARESIAPPLKPTNGIYERASRSVAGIVFEKIYTAFSQNLRDVPDAAALYATNCLRDVNRLGRTIMRMRGA